uniref:Uncharacterized protein n=1 Tax=Nelumbo nucifera TaxID=4432 RepID=A0A822Y4G0_NELNU|nr:TPA_asm: hypothetical protein HUJ06_027393 [Nelumbo nucifera]
MECDAIAWFIAELNNLQGEQRKKGGKLFQFTGDHIGSEASEHVGVSCPPHNLPLDAFPPRDQCDEIAYI